MSISQYVFCPTCRKDIHDNEIICDFEVGEQICSLCGTVLGEQRNNDFFTYESFLDVYHNINDTIMIEDRCGYMMGHESKMYGSRGSGLSGVGSNIITSFTETMDFSSVGIMSSMIDKKNVDYMGMKIKDTKTVNRMRYINNITTTSNNKNPNEKNKKQVVLLIKQISQKKNFPMYIQERAVNLYHDISTKNDVKRLQYKITAYWCLYYTLREMDMTPSLPEFLNWLVELGFIEENKKTAIQKKVNKVQIFILELMGMEPIPHSDYIHNITFLCNTHQLSEIIKRQCLELGKLIAEYKGDSVYQGRSPKTVATMLITIIMCKEDMRKECHELLKELKITSMVMRKIIQEVLDIIRKNNPETEERKRLERLLSIL